MVKWTRWKASSSEMSVKGTKCGKPNHQQLNMLHYHAEPKTMLILPHGRPTQARHWQSQ